MCTYGPGCAYGISREEWEQLEKRARLESAAPALLAACQAAMFVLENITSLDFSRGGDAKVRQMLSDAIGKATGK